MEVLDNPLGVMANSPGQSHLGGSNGGNLTENAASYLSFLYSRP